MEIHDSARKRPDHVALIITEERYTYADLSRRVARLASSLSGLISPGDRVFASRIRKTVRFAEAPVKGMSVLKYDPKGTAADAYRQLAKEVLSNGRP